MITFLISDYDDTANHCCKQAINHVAESNVIIIDQVKEIDRVQSVRTVRTVP